MIQKSKAGTCYGFNSFIEAVLDRMSRSIPFTSGEYGVPKHTQVLIHTVRITDLNRLNLVKLGYGGLILGSSQFLLLPQLP